MAKQQNLKIAVIGGGPVGLEAALYARTAGLSVTVYESGQPGEFVNRWGFVRMFTPFGLNATPLGKATIRDARLTTELPADTTLQTGREFRDTYLIPMSQSPLLKDLIRPQSTVLSVGRTGWRKTDASTARPLPPFRLLVRGVNNQESFDTADVVLDCSGLYQRPNWIGDGGIPAAGEAASRSHVPYWLEDVRGAKKAHYAGKSVIVVGGGLSAATTICDLTELATENQSTWVIWLTRGARTQPVVRTPNDPFRTRDQLATKANALATRCDGNLEHHPDTRIEEVVCAGPDKGCRVVAVSGGKRQTWEADRLIATVGYKPDLNLTSELRVNEPDGDVTTGEPGYFILGAKSHGRRSGFLLRDAHDQIRRVFAQIVGNAKFDLYAKAS
jgi:thioredoxin reductase